MNSPIQKTDKRWFAQQALRSKEKGWSQDIYVLGVHYITRYWITWPLRSPRDGGWDSSESWLLHQFFSPDLERAIHTHPYPFTSTILSGGYLERKSPEGWDGKIGPELDDCLLRMHVEGDTIVNSNPMEPHQVVSLLPDTWTLLHTGTRVTGWGFWEPGKPWKAYRE